MIAASSADVTRVSLPRLLRALATLASILCLGLFAHAQTPPPVAQLELAAPDATEFILRGTIPVPPHTFPRPDGRSLLPMTGSTCSRPISQTTRMLAQQS